MAATAASVARVAIVTGGAQGIGRGIVQRLVADSWRVVVVDRNPAGLEDFRHACPEASSPSVHSMEGDCGDHVVAKSVVAAAEERFGRLDLVVNNAGGTGIGTPLLELTPEQWTTGISANLNSCFFFSQAAAEALAATKGSIVNIASTRAFASEPHSETYAAAKGGVVALTHAMSASLTGRVRVNCICPGWIDVSGPEWGAHRTQLEITEEDKAQHFAGRIGTPADVAEAVVYLSTAGFVCGQTITIDGGMTKKMIYAE